MARILASSLTHLLLAILLSFVSLIGSSSQSQLEQWSILRPDHPHPHKFNYTTYNVLDYGAKGDGFSDDSEGFLTAWTAACQTNYSSVYVPGNMTFLLQSTVFPGPCGANTRMQIDGVLVAPSFDEWNSSNHKQWLVFEHLDQFTLEGSGTFDGRGESWWEKSCKYDHTIPCHTRTVPEALTIRRSSNVVVQNLNFVNSSQMHLIFDSCSTIRAQGLSIQAPRRSPNTDGIHLHAVQNALIQDTDIATGDDCISIQTGSSRVRVKNVTCGPGHGISIGSLGKDGSTGSVRAIVVDGAVLRGTTNGLRIKTWQGGHGSVYGVLYQNVRMVEVANPIIIDQYYCDSNEPCSNQTSAVEVSGVVYRNITGTSSTGVAVRFACSDLVPCHGIVLTEINLSRATSSQDPGVKSFCENAQGLVLGDVTPLSCLQ